MAVELLQIYQLGHYEFLEVIPKIVKQLELPEEVAREVVNRMDYFIIF
ncbi:hypothetical protein [Risungbinella massiliensis]|nr:hypothetical protein [Risungbinella massiliensis]